MSKNFSWKYILYLTLFCYICFISYSMYQLTNRMDFILRYPVRVSQETREMKTRVLEMQNTMPGLLSTPNLTYNDFEYIFMRQDNAQDASFSQVEKLFQGDRAYLANARSAFAKIREARRKAASMMIGNGNYEKALSVYDELVQPQVTNVYNALNQIFECANSLMMDARTETQNAARINIIITVILGAIIMLAFIYLDRREKIKNREILSRDRLFNQLSQNVDDTFIVAANADNFEYVSPNSKRLVGIDEGDLKRCPDLLYSFFNDAGKWLKENLASFPSGQAIPAMSGIEALVDGRHCFFKIGIHPIMEDGRPIGNYIVAIHDQTEEYQNNLALTNALEAKTDFLSHMSHEIRTPMNAIIGMTTIALSKIDDQARVEDCLGKIAESSKHLLGLINDILDMSKIDKNKMVINDEPFSLPQVIQNINDLVRPQTEAKGINFEIFQSVEEEKLSGDQLRLNQIILNIISNSVKFTPKDGTIRFSIEQMGIRQNQVWLRFVISDTGIGMTKEFLQRLFKPFEQQSASTSVRYGGTGLGMSITYNLVRLMHGHPIKVDSREGEGTTFTVELPFSLTADSGKQDMELPPLKVLVVDDDPGTCEHAKLLLSKMGMNVNYVLNGEAAVAEVAQAHDKCEDYDVCFIDWKMPGMDGAQTARQIRKLVGDDVLIIIISAYDWSAIEEEARQGGVNDFIAKPFFASSLYDSLLASTRRLGLGEGHAEQEQKKKEYDFSGKRVLLVEDNEFNREIAQEFLDMVNAEVETAEDGQQGVDMFLASRPGYYDLILMDVQMPNLDGYQATMKIRESTHPEARVIPIVAMTANAFNEDVAHAKAAGMNDHISKPINVDKLYEQMDKYIFGKPAAAGNGK